MKIGLFYFTGTGNSLYVTKALEEALGNTEIISIPQALVDREFLYEFDEVGFILPTYFGGLPKLVEKFIEQIELPRVRYIFAMTTKGKSYRFGTPKLLGELLAMSDYELNYGIEIQMPDNYIRKKNWYKLAKPKGYIKSQKFILDKAISDVKALEDNHMKKASILGASSGLIYKNWEIRLNKIDQSFTTSDQCMDCHICEVVCPVNNIKVVDMMPTWQGKCQDCMACIQICPSNNIQIGEYTRGKERFLNPYVDIKDIMDSNR